MEGGLVGKVDQKKVQWGTQAGMLKSITTRPSMKVDPIHIPAAPKEDEEAYEAYKCGARNWHGLPLEYELLMHGWEYDGAKTWVSDRWLEKGIKDRLTHLMHVFMSVDSEDEEPNVWQVCRDCRFKVAEVRWGA